MKTVGQEVRSTLDWLPVTIRAYVALSRRFPMRWLLPVTLLAFLGLLTTLPLSAQEPKLRDTLRGHAGLVVSVSFSPDGRTLASGSHDKTIRLWDVQTGKGHAPLRGHTAPVLSVAYSPDGKTLASGSSD